MNEEPTKGTAGESLDTFSCYYHPTIQAAEKCEKCSRMICLQCKMIHEVRTNSEQGTEIERHIYCPVCYHLTAINVNSTKNSICGCIFLTLFFSIPLAIGFFEEFPTYVQFIFFGFIGVIALFMIYHMLKKAPQLRREAEQQLERFCREIPLNTHFNRIEAQNERLMEKQGHSQSLCVGCKAALAEKVEFCPHCGYKQ